MRPDPETKELTVESLHPGVSRDMVIEATGWTPSFAHDLAETPPPSPEELAVLRDLNERTNRAHSRVEAAGE
jgi:glutaconate CoA-transferase subunit B